MRFLALCLLIALSACGLPANVVVLLPDEGGTVGAVSVDRNNTKEDLSVPYAATDTAADKSSRSVFVADQKTVEAEFSRVLASTPRKPVVYVIYFLIGQTEVDPRSVATRDAAVEAAHTTPFADISVVGHSDSVGSDEANLVLSMYRARVIQAALVNGGAKPSVIDVGYDGSNNPRIPRPRGVPEPENRRVEVTIR